MLESFRMFLGLNETEESRKRRLFALAQQLEELTGHSKSLLKNNTIEIARAIRDMLATEAVRVQEEDKLKISKIINRAKVRAIQTGSLDGYRMFKTLDSISEDVNPFL